MMGRQDDRRPLYCVVDLDQRVPASHALRKVAELIDFSFVRAEVAPFYGYNGNESVDPQVILKLMFLLFFDDVPSERELMRQVAYRLDYLWFLGMSLNDEVPDHSVLSKARSRWGPAAFEKLFVRTVRQCVQAGLVGGAKVHLDASVVDADASKDSVVRGCPQMIAALRQLYAEQEQKLESLRGKRRKRRPDRKAAAAPQPDGPQRVTPQAELPEACQATPSDAAPREGTPDQAGKATDPAPPRAAAAKVNQTLLSTTDPDAAVASHAPNCKSGPRPRYMSHRAVDDHTGVITAVASTPAGISEGSLLADLLDAHEQNTAIAAQVCVADGKYGTVENYAACEERGVRPHMADLSAKQANSGRREGIFPDTDFAYDPATDTYTCPAGQTLRPARHHQKRNATDYAPAKGVCAACPLKDRCTRSKSGRSVKRHDRQDLIDRSRAASRSAAARADRRRRMHLMERSFADASDNHGLKRSRWRRLWRQRIQDQLIAAAQNLRILAKASGRPARRAGAKPPPRPARRSARQTAPTGGR